MPSNQVTKRPEKNKRADAIKVTLSVASLVKNLANGELPK